MNRRDLLRLSATAAVTGGLRPPLARTQEPKLPNPDEMIHAYLKAEVERLSANFLDGAKTKDEWLAKRPALRKRFLDMAGLDPLPEKTPLKATITGKLDHDGVIIENLHFQSVPGLYVTGNLYRPALHPTNKDGLLRQLPAILYVCGHSNRGRDGNKTAFADHGMWFARNGYVCLVVDTLQLGEVAGKHHGTYNLERFWWHSRGYTPAGVECWNGVRAIDYLCSRPEVDRENIGVTGISGGGATTVWIAAADDRVKVAVPVSGMSDLESYVTNRVINGHCDCMFVYNLYRWEWTTILALFAPKPLLFANSDNDPIFPMDGNRRIVARLRRCYELLGAKDAVDEYVSKGGHAYREDLRLAVFGFLNKHLKGQTGPLKDAVEPKLAGKALRAFPEDADLPRDQINDKADEVFVPKAEVKVPKNSDEFAGWRIGLITKLRERCFRGLPPAREEVTVDSDGVAVTVRTVEGVIRVYSRSRKGKGQGATVVLLNPEEDAEAELAFWAKRYPDSGVYKAVWTRGGGPTRWTRKNPPNTVERSLALVGQTADSGRVWDAWVAIPEPRMRVRVVARGQAGVVAAYAQILADHSGSGILSELVILDPPVSHRDGPHFLGVLRVLDIPEALGLLTWDVKLTLVGERAKDRAFDRTATIYKLSGAEAKFNRE